MDFHFGQVYLRAGKSRRTLPSDRYSRDRPRDSTGHRIYHSEKTPESVEDTDTDHEAVLCDTDSVHHCIRHRHQSLSLQTVLVGGVSRYPLYEPTRSKKISESEVHLSSRFRS